VDGGWRTQKDKTSLWVGAALLGVIAGFVFTRSQRKRR
jgi:LPXTG-motif cell wall-anchored protein